MSETRLGFIGAGQMATALASGFISAGLVDKHSIWASDPSASAVKKFADATGGRVASGNVQAATESDIVFLAVKPQHMRPVLAELSGKPTAGKLVVSVAAGISLATLSAGLGPASRLIRVMPNTPCLVGQGASCYSLGTIATTADGQRVNQLLTAVGRAFEVPESLLDAVTGLSGSGPAFVYVMIEALSDGGVRMGLPRDIATALAAQTVRGAAEMVASTGEHPAVLKDRVASPGGTTIAGLQALENGGARAALMAAVEAATRRSIELSAAS